MDGKCHSDEVSDGTNTLLDNGEKAILVNKVEKNLAKLYSCPSVLWKIEHMNDEIRYMAEVISKQSIEGEAWFLLTAHS